MGHDWRQAASEAAAREDEREHAVMHHTAAWQLHLALSAKCTAGMKTVTVSSGTLNSTTPCKTVTVVQPRQYQRSNQSMHSVLIKEPAKLTNSAQEEETRSHTLFGVIVHCQSVVEVNTQVLNSI